MDIGKRTASPCFTLLDDGSMSHACRRAMGVSFSCSFNVYVVRVYLFKVIYFLLMSCLFRVSSHDKRWVND